MIKVKHVIVLAFLVGMLPFCGKNPVEPPADDNEERILFIRGSQDLSEICTMKPDGTDIQVVAHYDYDGGYTWEGYVKARWSSDKSLIVMAGGPGTNLEYWPLWIMDLEGKLLKQLTWNGHEPFWTRDDENIIHTRRRGYLSLIWDIYRINVSTLAEDTLLWAETGPPGTNSGYIYYFLDVFPHDDSKLLLREIYTYRDSSGKMTDDDSEIVIYDISSQQKFYLTDNDTEEGWAKVSPDGNHIVYTKKNPGVYPYSDNLYLMTAEGDSLRQLTTGTTDVYFHPLWSPDGNHLTYYKADQSEGYNPYGDVFLLDIQTGIERLMINKDDSSWSYIIVDWK